MSSSHTARDILVTSALPYANGPIHLGHLLEYIQTDIWVRAQKSFGNHCLYVCADDTHGTAITIKADAEGITPEQLIARVHQEHKQDFDDFHIEFDNYYSTHSPENKHFASLIYTRLRDQGYISTRSVTQAFDPEKQMFLADRYIKGSCPKCKAEDQYGDNCEQCGATYGPLELINPRSTLSGATPIEKSSEHYFFKLPAFTDMLKEWTRSGSLQTSVANKIAEWLDNELHEWDISRDAPYFGFEIPDAPGKFFYVWLDAPVGYMASLANLCQQRPELNFDHYWRPDSPTELYHFIGKDIVNFHTLFWPAMLEGSGFRKPSAVWVHGYVTVNGKKMSKSRGTFIKARTYLSHLNPEYLRYYYAAKLSDTVDDLDLNLSDFEERVNSDLVGKVVNIASRCAGFIHRLNAGQMSASLYDPALWQEFVDASQRIQQLYEKRQFNAAIREIMRLADAANKFVQDNAPWTLAKDPTQHTKVNDICSQAINLFRVLMVYLAPVLPKMATDSAAFLNCAQLDWAQAQRPLLQHRLNPFSALVNRVDSAAIQAMVDDSTGPSEPVATAPPAATPVAKPRASQPVSDGSTAAEPINFEQFSAVDLRVALVTQASLVEGADKLLCLQLDVGPLGQRQVFSGIRSCYQPADLVGKKVVLVANLAPRKMRFGLSEGMVLASGDDQAIQVVFASEQAQPGDSIR